MRSARVHRNVDVVDLRRAGDVLRCEVLMEGRTLCVLECVARAREARAEAGVAA